MSWEYWLFLIFAVIILAAAFYFTLRQDTQRHFPVRKEPSFSTASDKTAKDEAVETKTSEEPPAQLKQGTLPIAPFDPPSLPSPPDEMLPPGMCYEVQLFGKTPLAATIFTPLFEQLQKGNIRVGCFLGFDTAATCWRQIPDMPCLHWIIALPLANRGGTINDAAIRCIEAIVRPFSQKVTLHPVFPSAVDAIRNAALIDKFCDTVDMFIELRLVGEMQSPTRIDEVMRINGMVKEGDRIYLCRVDSENLFRAKVIPTPVGGKRQTVIFELDAPNVCDPSRAYEEMIRRIRRMAQVLNMRLTDPKGNEVDDSRGRAMHDQLTLLTSQMREFGVEPGGSLARLIFS